MPEDRSKLGTLPPENFLLRAKMPTVTDDMVNRRICSYRLDRELGHGGMGHFHERKVGQKEKR